MSDILKMAMEMATDLKKAGAIDDITMRQVETLCLPPKPNFTAADVRRIRASARMSQPVFAALLNVVPTTVAQWEGGQKKPSGSAARLLDLIDRKGVSIITS
ncbi:helix-turn-helix domain-containing protein [Lacibacterium aquatile]|uniref:Helix-turn-helix domain-containing protein n=1 Tax=Lacibacterium aquatile TaxID=1168082 RepID=A0ABW5DZG8_9PROT